MILCAEDNVILRNVNLKLLNYLTTQYFTVLSYLYFWKTQNCKSVGFVFIYVLHSWSAFLFLFSFFWGGGTVMHTVGFQCMIFVTPVLRVLFSLWREFWWIPTKACLCSGCWSTQLANSITLLVIQWEDREADSREREKHEPYQTQALIWCPSIRGITHQSPVLVKNAA